jgi:hypothetical protein
MRQPLLSDLSRRSKLRLLLQVVPEPARILEVGRGDGWFSQQLREQGYSVTTMDLVPPADVVGDVRKWRELGLRPATFDVVVALEVIEHVDCVQALTDLCKPNGTIMLSSPHPSWDWAMQLLETLRLTQQRTSTHCNLVNFRELPWEPIHLRRPGWIHQVGVFRNVPGTGGTRKQQGASAEELPVGEEVDVEPLYQAE